MIGRSTFLLSILLTSIPAAAAPETRRAAADITTRTLDRLVSDFPAQDDFSSPEAAYATINRRMANGSADWRALSIQRLAPLLRTGIQRPDPAGRQLLAARVIEVRIFRDVSAAVFARMGTSIDVRHFELENSKWLNAGNDRAADLDVARASFAALRSRGMGVPLRPPIANPAAHLKKFTDYLTASGQPPRQFILDALQRHKLVVIGEIHHRPTYWELNSSIITDPLFTQRAGVVYMELPSHAQDLVDSFLISARLDTAPVIEMLRDNLWMGWPDRPMLDFFVAAWRTNRNLPASRRIRIVLVDMPRPWKEIRQRQDWRKYDVDRDKLMADNILQDMAEHRVGQRHALFIVGFAHAQTLQYIVGDQPIPTAGWRLRQSLGKDLLTAMQHAPVLANMGGVSGRTCLGLFDSAFEANQHRPVAFALAGSPFGAQRYDADADRCSLTSSLYREAFDGYIYLGRLEDEIFSPLIDGFYTDVFARELDRRNRLMTGRGLVEGLSLPAVNAESFIAWMRNDWGQPRKWIYQLGPMNAWTAGDAPANR